MDNKHSSRATSVEFIVQQFEYLKAHMINWRSWRFPGICDKSDVERQSLLSHTRIVICRVDYQAFNLGDRC